MKPLQPHETAEVSPETMEWARKEAERIEQSPREPSRPLADYLRELREKYK